MSFTSTYVNSVHNHWNVLTWLPLVTMCTWYDSCHQLCLAGGILSLGSLVSFTIETDRHNIFFQIIQSTWRLCKTDAYPYSVDCTNLEEIWSSWRQTCNNAIKVTTFINFTTRVIRRDQLCSKFRNGGTTIILGVTCKIITTIRMLIWAL